jgi:glycosyltransferase involved in cell wall biosynthesis
LTALLAVVLVIGMSVFWATGIILWSRRRAPNLTELPFVSVILAGRDEEQFISQCLRAATYQDYPANRIEVLFVDDHSTDQTWDLARGMQSEFAGRLRIFRAPDPTFGYGPKKSALSFGIQQSAGELLLFTDVDGEVQPGWARAMVEHFETTTGAVTGATIPPVRAGLGNHLHRVERFMTSYASAAAIGYGFPASATGQNFAFRRSAFDAVGGYAHPTIASGDDDLMAQAIARHGWKVKFAANPMTVITDLRPPSAQAEVNAATRHQSTTRYYPIGWRMAYALTIVSGLSLLLLGMAVVISPKLFVIFAATVFGKLVIDFLAAKRFARPMQISLPFRDFLAAEALLPLYLILRPLLLLRPTFTWRDRSHVHDTRAASTTP